MAIDVLLGLQWGDEGKGKIVDYLAESYDIIARFQGGPNAGHTLKFDGKKFVLHTVPSGIFRERQINLIGNGAVIDPVTLCKELDQLTEVGVDYQHRLLVARKAHLILPTHRYLDAASEASKGSAKIGSTLKGIGPTYMDKTGRNGMRVGDLLAPDFMERYQSLKAKHFSLAKIYPEVQFDLKAEESKWLEAVDRIRGLQLVDSEYYINDALKKGKRILAEGAQGSMLDVDFGTYPFVTSSNTVTAGVCTGLGVAPGQIGEVIGIAKAYCTRVGSGPFPTELDNEMGEYLRKEGAEFGATTGRPRRCGWLDLPQLKYACMINGVTQLAITKADVLNHLEAIEVATHYKVNGQLTEQVPYDMLQQEIIPVYQSFKGWNTSLDGMQEYHTLPEALTSYLHWIETQLGIPVTMLSTGPERSQLITRDTVTA